MLRKGCMKRYWLQRHRPSQGQRDAQRCFATFASIDVQKFVDSSFFSWKRAQSFKQSFPYESVSGGLMSHVWKALLPFLDFIDASSPSAGFYGYVLTPVSTEKFGARSRHQVADCGTFHACIV